ncbi:MAG: hypothetical protein RIC30_04180 [Marinoscillum sp.]|uniref:hypothetical protein n=1 Tax=Marinoscillum sp. TaxID=2024838 RepID=UPI0032FA615E
MRQSCLIILVLWINACHPYKCEVPPPDVFVQLDMTGLDSSYLESLNWEVTTAEGVAYYSYEIRPLTVSGKALFQVEVHHVSESGELYLDYGNADVDTLMVVTHEEKSGCTRTVLDQVWMNGDLLTMNTDSTYFYQKRP